MTTASMLLKVTVTLVIALAGARLAHRSRASVRHLLLAASFAVLLLLPLASVWAPQIHVPVPIAAESAAALSSLDPMSPDERPSDDVWDARSARGATPSAAATLSAATLLVALWLGGVVLCLLPAGAGLWQLRAIRRSGLPWRDGQTAVDALAADAGINRRVVLLVHEAARAPITCGVLRPAIVLPPSARNWIAEDFTRAIVHELEHVRRCDWLSQCLARLIASCYWFHPLVWTAERQLVLEAERACDDAVLRRSEATDYADQLVSLAQRLAGVRQRAALGMANRADLAARVGAVLDRRQSRGRARASWVVLACAAAALLVTTISPLRIVASTAMTQTPAAQLLAAGSSLPRYDAATVKPCPPDEQLPGPARGGAGGTNATISPGRFFVPCVTTEQLIYLAHASYGARLEDRLVNDDFGSASDDKKIRGGPAWVHSYRDKYTIEAAAPSSVTQREILMGDMLRALLEDRFKLKVHRDSEEASMFTMTVAKSGFKLKPMKPGDCSDDRSVPFDPAAKIPPCGMLNMGPGRWRFTSGTMSGLAGQLTRLTRQKVIDQTGIADEFMFTLEFRRDESSPGQTPPAELSAEEARLPSLFTALEQQVGVKLEPIKGPRQFIVIDHIERPAASAPLQGAGARR